MVRVGTSHDTNSSRVERVDPDIRLELGQTLRLGVGLEGFETRVHRLLGALDDGDDLVGVLHIALDLGQVGDLGAGVVGKVEADADRLGLEVDDG